MGCQNPRPWGDFTAGDIPGTVKPLLQDTLSASGVTCSRTLTKGSNTQKVSQGEMHQCSQNSRR